MTESKRPNLVSTYLRLTPGGAVEPLPVDESFWPRLVTGQLGDFHQEYLVASIDFESDWPTWEMHPNGDEVVALLSGEVTLIIEQERERRSVRLDESRSFVIVPRGAWHTAKIATRSRMLFITPGEGAINRGVEQGE